MKFPFYAKNTMKHNKKLNNKNLENPEKVFFHTAVLKLLTVKSISPPENKTL